MRAEKELLKPEMTIRSINKSLNHAYQENKMLFKDTYFFGV